MSPQRASTKQPAPAEIINNLSQGLNLYTDVTLCSPKMWFGASNVYSGPFGYVQRARMANVAPVVNPPLSMKFFALPGLSNYLLYDPAISGVDGLLYSLDSGASYVATQRFNPYIDPTGAGSIQLLGPWSREVLQNIVYEMNGRAKMAGRLANAATIESWGLDTPDASPQVVITSGASVTISSITRLNGVVTAVVSPALTVPAGNGIGMVNVVGTTTDPSFEGTFILVSGNGTTTLTWNQPGFNSSPAASGTVTTEITKSTGRSYAWAWENANKFHISAPSPSTQYVLYQAQQAQGINCVEQGTIQVFTGNPVVTGTGTLFSAAWIGRSLWIPGGTQGRIIGVTSSTSLTLAAGATMNSSANEFIIYDPSATHIRLYATADGGATYFRVQRNAWNPAATTLPASGGSFFDTANSEPPAFPFTTETSQLYNIPPPIGQFVKEYQGSLLVYGVQGANQSFFYSNQTLTNVGQAQESYAPLNQVTLPIQNASVNGMVEFPGSLCIWSDKQDMFRLTGLLTDNTSATATAQGATIAALPYNLGCASPFAVALTPLGAFWLTSNAEIWVFTDAYAPKNVGRTIQSLLSSILPANLSLARMTYYHTNSRNWLCLAVAANGATANNTLLVLDLDLLASNGSPSFFTFDMATNTPSWYVLSIPSILNPFIGGIETMYETTGAVRLLAAGANDIVDMDYVTGLFGTEFSIPGANLVTHAWGNDSPFIIKRPSFLRFNTNRDPALLAADGWSFGVLGIDDDFYNFDDPLALTLQPGVNDSATFNGSPIHPFGRPFRDSAEMYRIGGVNFVMGRRLQFIVNFPSGTGTAYQFRGVQLGFGPSPPR